MTTQLQLFKTCFETGGSSAAVIMEYQAEVWQILPWAQLANHPDSTDFQTY